MVENGPGVLTLGTADRAAAIAAVKARLRVAGTDEDALVAAFAETALGLAERFTGQTLLRREMVQTVAGRGAWQVLAACPVMAITAVADPAGATIGAGDQAVDIDGAGRGWIRLARGRTGRVTFSAGLAPDWPTLPAAIREGTAMLAAHLFDDRTGTQPVPAAVTALWRPFRIVRLVRERRA